MQHVLQFRSHDATDHHEAAAGVVLSTVPTRHEVLHEDMAMNESASLRRGLFAVIAAAVFTQAPVARSEIVDTDALSAPTPNQAPTQADLDRAKVQQFIDNTTVKDRMKAMGVSGILIEQRLAALSPAEVHALAERIDTMPAGGSFTDTQIIIIILIAILIAVIV
jgi:hypothetical protein